MRVAVLGNIAGVGVRRSASLRRLGHDVRLFVSIYESGISDPLRSSFSNVRVWTWPAPQAWARASWSLRIVRKALIGIGIAVTNVELSRYDIVHALGTLAAYGLGVHRPLVVEPVGSDIVEIGQERTLGAMWRARMWKRAGALVASSAGIMSAASGLGLTARFVPLPIDTDLFRPQARPSRDHVVVFHPSRHDWGPSRARHKGNDVLIRGLAAFIRSGGKAQLRCVNHGEDVPASRALIEALGIAAHVRWLDVLGEEELIQQYQEADVVADQFRIGALGQVALEGLACGAPLLTNYSEDNRMTYGEHPPRLQAAAAEEVTEALVRAGRAEERARLGDAGRAWVVRHHSFERAAEALSVVYGDVLSDGSHRQHQSRVR